MAPLPVVNAGGARQRRGRRERAVGGKYWPSRKTIQPTYGWARLHHFGSYCESLGVPGLELEGWWPAAGHGLKPVSTPRIPHARACHSRRSCKIPVAPASRRSNRLQTWAGSSLCVPRTFRGRRSMSGSRLLRTSARSLVLVVPRLSRQGRCERSLSLS